MDCSFVVAYQRENFDLNCMNRWIQVMAYA